MAYWQNAVTMPEKPVTLSLTMLPNLSAVGAGGTVEFGAAFANAASKFALHTWAVWLAFSDGVLAGCSAVWPKNVEINNATISDEISDEVIVASSLFGLLFMFLFLWLVGVFC